MISKEQVSGIAKLARLELSEQEREKMQNDMSAILDYFDVLKKAPKIKVTEKSDSAHLRNLNTRKDIVREKPAGLAGDLVNAAPDKKDGYIKVKQIL
jgi:aspartyl-tRNA(Asn)/glutamyl-tRNA(Gln) amidotransferase subunit C